MQLTDMAPLERWIELEKDILDCRQPNIRLGMPARIMEKLLGFASVDRGLWFDKDGRVNPHSFYSQTLLHSGSHPNG
jgi:hypothetical protein